MLIFSIPFDLLFEMFGLDYPTSSALGRTSKTAYDRWYAFSMRNVPASLMRFYRGAVLRCVVNKIVPSVEYDVSQLILPPSTAKDYDCICETIVYGMSMATNERFALSRLLKCSDDDLRLIQNNQFAKRNDRLRNSTRADVLTYRDDVSIFAAWASERPQVTTIGEALPVRWSGVWGSIGSTIRHGLRIVFAAKILLEYTLKKCTTHPLLPKHIVSEALHGSLHAMPFVLSAYFSLPTVNRQPRLPLALFHGRHCVVNSLDLSAYCLFYAMTAAFYTFGNAHLPKCVNTEVVWRFNTTNGLFLDNHLDTIICPYYPIDFEHLSWYRSAQRYLRRQLFLQPMIPASEREWMQTILPSEWNLSVVWARVVETRDTLYFFERNSETNFGLPNVHFYHNKRFDSNGNNIDAMVISIGSKVIGCMEQINQPHTKGFVVGWTGHAFSLRADFVHSPDRCRVLRMLNCLASISSFDANSDLSSRFIIKSFSLETQKQINRNHEEWLNEARKRSKND